MSAGARGGFSLLELVVALGVGMLALAAAASLFAPVARTQAAAQASLTAQLGADAALAAVERVLRQATLLGRPSLAGVPSSSLEGCVNAAVWPGSSVPAAIDPAAPVSGFAFCAADHALWLHQGPECPLSYVCGAGSGVVVAGARGGPADAAASFVLESARGSTVAAELTVRSGPSAARAFTAVALSRAANPAR